MHTVKELLASFVLTISFGGNYLLNVGPDPLGRIPAIFEDRLRQLGRFVNAYSEAIFETKPWIHQNDSEVIWQVSDTRQCFFSF